MKEAWDRGYDTVHIAWRGFGSELKSPVLHNANSTTDLIEPMEYVYDKFYKGRKAYAVGCSMGSNVIANSLGLQQEDTILSGAVCCQAAIKKWKCLDYFEKGFIN